MIAAINFRNFFVLLVVCMGAWLMPQRVLAQQPSWRNFRGENYDGKSSEIGIVDQWSEKGPPVLWTRDLGAGYSSFVGAEDRVFTQYQTLAGQFVVCLNASTGKTIWEHRYGWPYKPASLYPGPRSSPTVSGDRVFFATPDGSLGCLDIKNGELIWKVEAAKKFDAPKPEFGFACTPTCIDGKVILPVGGKDASMVAFDQVDGSVVWNAGNDQISYCSAYPIEFQGQRLVVGYFKNKLCVFDRETGSLLATTIVSFDYDEHSAWPIYREPYLWASGPFRAGSQLIEITNALGGDQGSLSLKLIYKSDTMSNDVASSVLVGDSLFGFDLRDVQSKVHRPSRGQFVCMDLMTGKTRWTHGTLRRRKNTDEFIASSAERNESDVGHASVIYADDKLILFNDTGELILCRADDDAFVPLDRTHLLGGEICWAPPMLMNRRVIVRNHRKAVCVYLGDLAELEVETQDIVFADDIPQPKFFDLSAMLLGTEPTYAMTSPKAAWLIRWYWISLLLGWGIAPAIALPLKKVVRIRARRIWIVTALLLGVAGTTFFGHWFQEFYFSWPIVLALVFESVVCRLQERKPTGAEATQTERPWLSRLLLIGFALLCLGYFYLCRRLSLAFEWAFLIGFPTAIPFLWLVKREVQQGKPYGWSQWASSGLAFTAFYWTGAGVILWRYAV